MNNTQTLLKTLLKSPSSTITSRSQAKQLHAQIIKHNLLTSSHTTTILSIYSHLNLLHDSLLVFNTLNHQSTPPNSIAYKSIIKCYSSNGFPKKSLSCFVEMRNSGIDPDHNMFPSVLKCCALLLDLRLGESVHGCIVRLGFDFDLYTGNALMSMYSKLENVDAHKVFDGIPEYKKSIGGLDNGSSCGNLNNEDGNLNLLGIGRKSCVLKVFETMPVKDIVSWNTVISGHVQNGMFEKALTMVRQMGVSELKPDTFTLSSVLPIFAEHVDLAKGKEIHGYTIRHGLVQDMFIGSSLIDMYAKCTRIEDSCHVFLLLPRLDSISWNSIIAGCVQNGHFDEGLNFFRQMLEAKVKPKHVSLASIMPACAHLTTLHLGKQLHGYIVRGGFDDNRFIASSLVDMYAKCGNIKTARRIFDKMENHDMVSWTAMIMGYASHGHANDAISVFELMKAKKVRPNYVAFVAVLMACSHAGMVEKGWNYFNNMSEEYGISPGLEHYAAMADLLGRAGKLDEAFDFISNMRVGATGSVWSTLLAACRVHKNVELAEKVAEKIFLVDPENTGAYILLSNVYSAAGRWEDKRKTIKSMRNHGMRKEPACSWIEINNKVHTFNAGDESHPFYDSIISTFGFIMKQMEGEGYVPNTREVLHDFEG